MYSASDWQHKIDELSEIYRMDAEVETRHLSQHRHFITSGDTSIPFLSAHAVYLGLRGEDMRGRDGKTQNIRTITSSIARHGYRRVERASFEFEAIWPTYLRTCQRAGRNPSGGNSIQPMDRSFFVKGDILRLKAAPIAEDVELRKLEQFQRSVQETSNEQPSIRRVRLKEATGIAKAISRQVTAYLRNPDVVAERLSMAKGICEDCGSPAPFLRASNGTPFLEVHHILPLADGGADTVENTKALCPNCHRKAHFG